MVTRVTNALVLLSFVNWTTVLGIPIDNGLVPAAKKVITRTEEVCGTDDSTDFIIVVDGSTSIGKDNFQKLTRWLSDTAKVLPESNRYAVIEFSGHPVTLWNLAAYSDRDAVVKAFLNMRYITGTTKVAAALEYLISEGFLEQNNGNREDVPDTVVVITDGRSSDDPHDVAMRLRDQYKATIYAIGITSAIDHGQLNDLVTGMPDDPIPRYLAVPDFDRLDDDLRRQLIDARRVCRIREITEEIGEDDIELKCNTDSIYVGAKTRNPFDGRVYVKGMSDVDECKFIGDGKTTNVSLTMDMKKCATTTRKSLDPPGVFIENDVVISFHQRVVTKVDRAFKVRCFYMEANKDINAEVTVNKLTTQFASEQFPMPTCTYTLHRDAPDGPTVRFAVVGESIFHRWECDDSWCTESGDLFKLKVHSCYVENDKGRVDLLDTDGCAIDRNLLDDLTYVDGRMLAHVESHVFKFPDNPNEQFQCEIEICVNLEDGCAGVPPMCNEDGGNRRLRRETATSPLLEAHQRNTRSIDVNTEQLMGLTEKK